jgi:predicted DCC family thiol-disulfide oxidoreductase YuxK
MSGTATVVYDGECGLCTTLAGVAARRLGGPVDVVALHDADLDRLGVADRDARRALQWIGADGERHQGHRAIAAWLSGTGHRKIARLLTAPGVDAVAGLAYRFVATNRRRIPGRLSAAATRCRPPRSPSR